jgi:hypothetical protein
MTNAHSAIGAFSDVLLPGAESWPAASHSPAVIADLLDHLDAADRLWLVDVAARIAAHPLADRPAAMAALEGTAPAPFNRVLAVLYDAYYAAPAVHAVIQQLAAEGPRETSPFFDTTWLHRMIAARPGQYRQAPTTPAAASPTGPGR